MQDYTKDPHHHWILWGSIAAAVAVGVGVFFYYTFLKQSQSDLLATVPPDAAFIFEVNDNDAFVSQSGDVTPYLNELFVMDALPAYETVYGKLGADECRITVSCHEEDNGMYLLFNTAISRQDFKRLLKDLNIDPKNNFPFEEYRIYTYGTNYKSLKMAYYNHVLSISENVDLLKKALVLRRHPKTLLSDKSFRHIYHVVEKNRKQNWLILHNDIYIDYLSSYAGPELSGNLALLKGKTRWSAFQVRGSGLDLFLSGYTDSDADEFAKLMGQKPHVWEQKHIVPAIADWYYKIDISDCRELTDKMEEKRDAFQLKPGAIRQFSLLAPRTACCFRLPDDSGGYYRYLAVQPDTSAAQLAEFYKFANADSNAVGRPDGIHTVGDAGFNGVISVFDHYVYRYCIEKNGYCIFAPSADAVRMYQKQTSFMEDNRYFRFTKDNISSRNLLEFSYFNNFKARPLLALMSAKGRTSRTARDLVIFSINCNGLPQGYAALNLYLHFASREPAVIQ